jgi:hypothetical protein
MSFNTTINPFFFPPAPQPLPLMAPSPNPFFNPLRSQTATLAHLTIAQTQTTKSLANLPYPTNPFIQTDTVCFARSEHQETKPQERQTRKENIQNQKATSRRSFYRMIKRNQKILMAHNDKFYYKIPTTQKFAV